MHKQTKIFSLWAVSTIGIIVAVIATAGIQSSLENKSTNIVSSYVKSKQSQRPLSKLDNKTRILSRQIVAKVYNAPDLTRGLVLGETTGNKISQEEISDISTPTIVRIVNQVKGNVAFEEFDIDLFTGNLSGNGTIYSSKVENAITGTGFFIDERGHILTNSHVVDDNILFDVFIDPVLDYYGEVVDAQLNRLSDAEAEQLLNLWSKKYGSDPFTAAVKMGLEINDKITDYIADQSEVDVKQKLAVINPIQDAQLANAEFDLQVLIDNGFEANIIDWDKNYLDTGKDVALIKINQSPTPFISLDDKTPNIGQQIYVIGFPANAEINQKDLFEKSMTQGSINSIKDDKGLKVYQFDAKISKGSSGSPLLNSEGKAIGVVSFLTGGLIGDSFAFAIPISHAKTIMEKHQVSPGENIYYSSFLAGLNFAKQDLCRKANEQFEISRTQGKITDQKGLQKHITDCAATIASGTSKDGTWYDVKTAITKTPIYLIAGAIGLLLITAGTVYLLLLHKKRESEGMIMASPQTT